MPTGTTGDILIHNGTSWVGHQRIVEVVSGIASTNFNLATLPKSYAPIDVYRNGNLQAYADDYTRSGVTITFIIPLVASEKVTTIYHT